MVTSFRTTRDRFGRLHRVRVISFVGLGYPGYYGDYPYYDNGYDQTADQSTYDNTQQSSQPDYDQGPSQYATATAPPPDATVPDSAQLILMRKDGQIVMPAAFTISGDKLVYVTREGARLSFPLADLDKDTTRKMNAANGTNVVIPD